MKRDNPRTCGDQAEEFVGGNVRGDSAVAELTAAKVVAMRALDQWRESHAPEAPDRVDEFEELVSQLAAEIEEMEGVQRRERRARRKREQASEESRS